MAEPKLTIPHAIGWSVISSVLVFIATAIWVGRGAYAELQAVRESAADLAAEQRATNGRVSQLEQAIRENKVNTDWILKALERQERRNGYIPPPLPPAQP